MTSPASLPTCSAERVTGLLADTLRAGITAGATRGDLDPDATAAVLFEIGWATVRAVLQGDTELPLASALDVLNSIIDTGISARAQQARRRAERPGRSPEASGA